MKRQFKRIFSIFLVSVILSVLTVGFLTRPVKTHAFPIAAIALGSGALGAIVAAYFATAGVKFIGSESADSNFLGNYVANWVKSSSSYENNLYFDDEGNFIGSSNDLSIVQNEDTDLVSFIFGKEFAIWLEAIKQQFVSDNNLSSEYNTNVHHVDGYELANGSYLPMSYKGYMGVSSWYSRDGILIPYGLVPGETCSYVLANGNSFTIHVDATSWGGSSSITLTKTINDVYTTKKYTNLGNTSNATKLCIALLDNYGTNAKPGVYFIRDNYPDSYLSSVSTPILNFEEWESLVLDQTAEEMSLDGTLTDGYEDFEEAINQDLTNADEEEVAVVDVGSFPDLLNPDALVDAILDKIVDGTLNPEYDGTRENTESAEEEKEGDKPFSPTVPEGWVIVNGLEDFFPFCIPWDLYNLIAELNVTPKAPKFNYKVDLDAAIDGLQYDAELDLAPFEPAARVFRIIIVIGFVFFLILKTRDLIRG